MRDDEVHGQLAPGHPVRRVPAVLDALVRARWIEARDRSRRCSPTRAIAQGTPAGLPSSTSGILTATVVANIERQFGPSLDGGVCRLSGSAEQMSQIFEPRATLVVIYLDKLVEYVFSRTCESCRLPRKLPDFIKRVHLRGRHTSSFQSPSTSRRWS